MKDLWKAAVQMSVELHAFEREGGQIPYELDKAWQELTTQIEKLRPKMEAKNFNSAMHGMKL